MNIQIIDHSFQLTMFGVAGTTLNKDYAGTAFKLSGKMWATVKANNVKNKGINIWVYELNDAVFAGVELVDVPEKDIGLEQKSINLPKYAYYKHVGPYNLIKQAGLNMQNELARKGLEVGLPYIEIYGHWKSDETKLETELLMAIK